MCGICGVYGVANETETTGKVLAMMQTLEHRGPDGSGHRVTSHCGLGHRRLAILDLSERGSQPMSNETDTVQLVVNGEVYNYRDLRRVLRAKGHTFRSDSDSEVVVHAYEEYGDDAIPMLRGMFALAIYDQTRQRLLLARDPAGKKPLYYSWQGHTLLFASEVKALLAAGVPALVNHAMLPSYLRYQYVPGTQTLFGGIHKLSAGHMLSVDNLKASPYLQMFSSITDADPYKGSPQSAIGELRALLEESVKLRLQSDVPVGAFLSGGIDSSAVTALYRHCHSGPLHTFTATFEGHSEGPHAFTVSQHLQTEHHEVPITAAMAAQDMAHITHHHDEPLGDAAIINNYYLAQAAKPHVTVVLAGEGGDEVFGGYPWHRYAWLADMWNRTPARLRRTLAATLRYLPLSHPGGCLYSAGRLAGYAAESDLHGLLSYPTTGMSRHTVRWLTGHRDGCIAPHYPSGLTVLYNRALGMDFANLLPEKFLMKADKATMAWGIEERLPLLDRNLVEFAFRLSPQLKGNKYVLRAAVKDLLPPAIAARPKAGFGTPVASWLAHPSFQPLVRDALNGPLLREICRPLALARIRQVAGQMNNNGHAPLALTAANLVWTLVALQVWHDIWFGGQS